MVNTVGSIEKFRSEDEDYEVVSLLGAGGMGTVYKARQKSLGRFVAIKALNPESCGDVDSIARLKREALSAALVSHPNVVKVHSLGLQSGSNQPFIVMEFVEGRSLDDILHERGTLPESEAVALITQVLDGLTALHDAGLVHRDIKPHNIVVTADGGVKLMDLGIVKALDRTTQKLTQTGATIGSPAYMSPEQCSGAAKIDGRSDLYSVGCTLYRALSGKEPFEADTALEVMLKHLHDPAPRLDQLASANVSAAVATAMEKNVADRFATADDFKQALLGKVEVTAPMRKNTIGPAQRKSFAPVAVALGVSLVALSICVYAAMSTQQSIGDSLAAKTVAELERGPDGRDVQDAINRVDGRLESDPVFIKLPPAEKEKALKPVVQYAQNAISKLRAGPPEDRMYPVIVMHGYLVAAYDTVAGTKIIQSAIDEHERLAAGRLGQQDVWSHLATTYCTALRSYQARRMNKPFDETFKQFEASLQPTNKKGLQLKDAAGAYLIAADHRADLRDYAGAETLARKALNMRQEAELNGTIEQVVAYSKLCEELHNQGKWKELIAEAEKALPASGLVMDKADDKYEVRKERVKIAKLTADACEQLGNKQGAEQYRAFAIAQSQPTELTAKQAF